MPKPRRAKVARAIKPDKPLIERAAIAACSAVYGRRCPCEKAPSTCDHMILAARAVLQVVDRNHPEA